MTQRPAAINPPTLPELLTVAQVASRLQVDAYTVRRWAREGALPAYRVGREFRFATADVAAHLARSAVQAKTPTPRRRPS